MNSSLDQLKTEFTNLVKQYFDDDVIKRDKWINLPDNINDDVIDELICLRRNILQTFYFQLYESGKFDKYFGKWIVLVGDCIWDEKVYESENEAISGGYVNEQKGYPPVIFTIKVEPVNEQFENDCFELLQELKNIASLTKVAAQSVVTSLIEDTVQQHEGVCKGQREFCQKAIDKMHYLNISEKDKLIIMSNK